MAVDDAGLEVDGQRLLEDEGRAVVQRQGHLRDDLFLRSQSPIDRMVHTWIWADVREESPPKEKMLSDKAFAASYESGRLARVRAQTAKITQWLDRKGFSVHERGDDTPVVVADVPSSALKELGMVDGVAIAGEMGDIQLAGTAWFNATKADLAQAIVPSASIGYCNSEGRQPDSYSFLNVPAPNINSTTALMDAHTRWTTEIISGTSGLRMAPNAPTFMADWTDSDNPNASFAAQKWCFKDKSVSYMNRSWYAGTLEPGVISLFDMAADYWVKNPPYATITNAAGDCKDSTHPTKPCAQAGTAHTVGSRGFNFLVIGGSNDNTTPGTSDDTIADFSAWTNPVSTHSDHELPYLVAPAVNVDTVSVHGDGNSISAPMTLGAALLAVQRDTIFAQWPEMTRASLLATATHPVDGSRLTSLPSGDLKQGAGLLNTKALVDLSDPVYQVPPNSTAVPLGRWAKTYNFATDFPGGYSTDHYDMYAGSAARMRVALAWDSTATGCSTVDAHGCTGDALDADLDLQVLKQINGVWQMVCSSTSYDSSWELCDVGINPGETLRARIHLVSQVASSTYVGIAWQKYLTTSE